MKKMFSMAIACLVMIVVSCTESTDSGKKNPKISKDMLIFPKGNKLDDDRFHGTAWLQSLVVADNINHIAVGSVTFEPGARTKWHLHPDGQIILALSGTGYYQEQGSAKIILRKGDVVTCPPDVPHWHGAGSGDTFVQVAITSRLKGPTEWLHAVSDADYQAGEM